VLQRPCDVAQESANVAKVAMQPAELACEVLPARAMDSVNYFECMFEGVQI